MYLMIIYIISWQGTLGVNLRVLIGSNLVRILLQDHYRTIKSIITQIFLHGSQKIPSKAQPGSKKLVLTFAKMAILNSRAIDFLVTLHLMKVSVHGQPVRTISYLINNQSYLSGGLKLAAKTNQFCAQTP